MWYHGWGTGSGESGQIGYATSPDGIIWTRSLDNPVLTAGGSDSWEYPHVFDHTVLFDPNGGLYRMWYASYNEEIDGRNRFGYATSVDGAHWTKWALNPVFYPGEAGSWDGGDIHHPCVILEGNTLRMWYAGHDGSYGIGYAIAEPGGAITGHVLSDGSGPLADAHVYALDSDLNVVAGAVAEADGSYAILDLPTGDYYIEANASGYGREHYDDSHDITGAVLVNVTKPLTTTDIDFTLASGGAISGHVYRPDGVTPFEGAIVEVRPAGDGRPSETSSASDGAYSVHDLATGNYSAWAGHSSYVAGAEPSVSVTQPNATHDVDLILPGPYFPLGIGTKWIYAWRNDTHHADLITETIEVTGQSGTRYTLGAHHEQADGQFWLGEWAHGLRWSGWSTQGGPGFPLPMYMLLYYAYVPTDFFRQPLLPGENWLGWGRTEVSLPEHDGLSTVSSVSQTVSVTAGTFTDVMQLNTVISGTNDYLSGERDMWFAPGVGLIKLVYSHDDGSVTTAELVGGPYSHYVHLPLAMRGYQPPGPAFGDVIRTIPSPGDGAQGLAWDGTHLWVAWGSIYRLDPSDGSVVSQIPYPAGDIQGLTWDGSSLWCASYATDTIYRLDPNDGSVLQSFPSPASKPIGLAWDGTYLWNSDENGTFYKLDPSDGSVEGSFSSPLGSSTTMLAWDGHHLWASTGGRFSQFDTSSWQTLKYILVPAQFSKGIAWDGENLWNGGFEDDTLYLIDAVPSGASISGDVLKNGAPIAGKDMYIVKNSNTPDEMQIGWASTDGSGNYAFTVDPDVEYELRGFGDTSNNEFHEWVRHATPSPSNPDTTLADVDIWYGGLLAPAGGATFNRDEVNAGNPIAFSWSAKSGATDYAVWLRQRNEWGYTLWRSLSGPDTTVNFDGTIDNGVHLPAMEYDWHVGMGLSNGWWVWSEHRWLDVSSTALAITIDGNPGDWAASVPVFTDAAGDNGGGPAGTDIGSVRSYVDDSDVYILVEVHDPSMVYTATIELTLDYKPGKHHSTSGSTVDLGTNIWNGGISAWVGDNEPYDITGAQVAFGEGMEIRIPRNQLEDTTYAIPVFVNIWVDGTGWDPSHIVH
jgi:hypothetical protein